MSVEDAAEPGLDGVLGVRRPEVTADGGVAVWTIGPQHLQQFGLPHGGAYCAVHESTASLCGFTWINRDLPSGHSPFAVVGVNNSTDFLRQAKVGDTITTSATPVHRGRTQQLWRVESRDQDGRLVAQGQVRLANLSPTKSR